MRILIMFMIIVRSCRSRSSIRRRSISSRIRTGRTILSGGISSIRRTIDNNGTRSPFSSDTSTSSSSSSSSSRWWY